MEFFKSIAIRDNKIIAGEEAVVIYNGELTRDSRKIFLHYGLDNWKNINEVEMRETVDGFESKIAIPLNSNSLSFSFRNEKNSWDNNNNTNYNFSISPATILTSETSFSDIEIEDNFFNTDFLLSYNLNQEIRNQKVFDTVESVMNEEIQNTNYEIKQSRDITEFNVQNFSGETEEHQNTAVEKDLDDTLINYSNFSSNDITQFSIPNLAVDENGEIIDLESNFTKEQKESPMYYEALNSNQEIATMLLETHNKLFRQIDLDEENAVLGMEYSYSDSLNIEDSLDNIEVNDFVKKEDLTSNLIYFKAKHPYVKMFKEEKVKNIQSLIDNFKEEENIFLFKPQINYANTLRKIARQNLLNLEIEKQKDNTNFLVVSPYSEIYAEDDSIFATVKKYARITVKAFKSLSSYLKKAFAALEERQ